MVAIVNINGRLYDERDALISVFDHGFLFGDGVYEVLRTYGRHPFLFDAHQRRLRESARRLAIAVPFTDEEILGRIRDSVHALPGSGEAYVRVLLTRGIGELSYDPAACPAPSLVIIVKPHVSPPPYVYEQGIRVALVSIRRNPSGSLDPRIKSNNLLNNVLAMQEALERGASEALMRNHREELVECSQSNFFLVHAGEVLTPPLDAGLLAGVTRALVFQLASACGTSVREAHLYEQDLSRATEAFITSTTREIVPVIGVDGHIIGSGTPGAVTTRLLEAFREHTAICQRQATRPQG